MFLVACGPSTPDVEVTLKDDSATVTTKPGDALFSLTLKTAKKPYKFALITVAVNVPGKSIYGVTCTHDDTNKDNMWDVGESIQCKEPVSNIIDPTLKGKELAVSISSKGSDGVLQEFAAPTWTVDP